MRQGTRLRLRRLLHRDQHAAPSSPQVFDEEGALDRLEAFTSRNGAAFYRLPPNQGTITLERRDAAAEWPESIAGGAGPVTVFDPGFPVYWHVQG